MMTGGTYMIHDYKDPNYNNYNNWFQQPVYIPYPQYSYGYSLPIQNKIDGDNNMKNLFNVVVVNLEGEILLDKKIVASDNDEAKFLLGVDEIIRTAKLLPKDVTVLCNVVGQVKVKKDITEVKVIKE
jgi:hypothetical protein